MTPLLVDDEIQAQISVLTPSFEATRAKLLPIPASGIQYPEWAEDANPYAIAASALADKTLTVFVDGSMRKFIADGLQGALPNATIASAPLEIRQLRERKSEAEIELLKCANEVRVYDKCLFGIF